MKNRFMARFTTKAILLSLLVLPSTGCVELATMLAHATGGDWIEPEFKLTKGPLLILTEDPSGFVSHPKAMQDLHKQIAAKFLEMDVDNKVVPLADIEAMQRRTRDYESLSIREIGEKLGAEEVLYLRVEKFTLQAEEGAPLFKGEFVVRAKVLSTKAEREVRLWPRDPSGRSVSVTTPPIPTDSGKSASDIARELAANMGSAVAKLFYGYRELDE